MATTTMPRRIRDPINKPFARPRNVTKPVSRHWLFARNSSPCVRCRVLAYISFVRRGEQLLGKGKRKVEGRESLIDARIHFLGRWS